MRILIDINHPAHVHYFKNFIKIMEKKEHTILVISRNKEIEHYLLKQYNILFIDRGKGRDSFINKIGYFFKAIYFIYRKAKKFKPDTIISFGTPYPAIVGFLINTPHISFNDTESAKLHHLLTNPFSKHILTPYWYNTNLGKKHIRFNNFMESCYLHPSYFVPDPSVLEILKISKGDKYVILRFVSWNAAHDVGHSGLSIEMKHKMVMELTKRARVFISSEGQLPDKLIKYQIKIPPEKMHDALFYSSLYVGESPTMTTESALLGTPAICISSWACNIGNFQELKRHSLIECFKPYEENDALKKAIEYLSPVFRKQEFQQNQQKIVADKINLTAFMVWFFENYPKSVKVIMKNPEYQNKFI